MKRTKVKCSSCQKTFRHRYRLAVWSVWLQSVCTPCTRTIRKRQQAFYDSLFVTKERA